MGLCKLADAQILSDLGIEIDRLEAEILKSKQKEVEELISHMVNMLYEVSPYTHLIMKEKREKENPERERQEKERLEKLQKDKQERRHRAIQSLRKMPKMGES